VDLGGKATAISAGLDHTCALLEDQTIRCWGANDFGQLGLGNNTAQVDKTPNALGAINVGGSAIAISAGGKVSCAVLSDGSVRCWGRNLVGALGLGNSTAVSNSQKPNQFGPISLGTTATAVSTGSANSCALLTGGNVRCWGFNGNGELGIQSTTTIGDNELPSTASTVALPSGRSVVALAVGTSHTCARLDNGDVECWGFNSSGQLGVGHTSHIGDGESPAVWGIPPTTSFDASAIDTGDHTCALFTGGGGLRCWGNNSSAQLGLADVNPRGQSNSTTPDLLTPIAFGAGRSAKGAFAGVAHTCALLDNDSLRCWGSNQAGQLGLGFVSGAVIGSLTYVGGDANSTPDKLANLKVFTSAD
jgi:alpha-tubulin suppressor-like RCC1 family protein